VKWTIPANAKILIRERHMKLRLIVLLIAAATLFSGIQLFGHHSFAATYFEDKQQTIEGDLVQFIFWNPHSLKR